MNYLLPEKTEWMKKQNLHEPTRLYAEELNSIISNSIWDNALEIGNAWGVSTLVILKHARGLVSVDPDETTHALREVKANDLENRFNWIKTRSKDFWKQNQQSYDLIFLDGSHNYEDIYLDLFEAWKVIKDNGRLIIDDVTHRKNYYTGDDDKNHADYGVAFATWEFIKDHNITHIHTTKQLVYINKGENL